MNRIGSKSGQPQIMKAEIATAAQAARVIVQGVREGRTEVTMRLRPEGLGPVRIDLAMQNDQIEARIEAATPAARELLNEGLDHLRGALEARGIGVSKLEVVLAAESRHDAQLDDQLPNADRHGDPGGSHDGQDGRRQNRERETDGTTAEPWSAAGAAEPAGMWIERDQSGLAQVRIDATV
jgi:flagellar hook-length control protein FliK